MLTPETEPPLTPRERAILRRLNRLDPERRVSWQCTDAPDAAGRSREAGVVADIAAEVATMELTPELRRSAERHVCYHSTAHENLCLCQSKGGTMMKDNGKDTDIELVQGNAAKSAIVALRVTKSTVSETIDGVVRAVLTISGTKLIDQKFAGEDVNLATSGGRAAFGRCLEVKTTAGKEGKKIYRMKIEGARDLDALVGLQVTVDQAQGELPLPRRGRIDA